MALPRSSLFAIALCLLVQQVVHTDGRFLASLLSRKTAQKSTAALMDRPVIYVPYTIYIPVPVDKASAYAQKITATLPSDDLTADATVDNVGTVVEAASSEELIFPGVIFRDDQIYPNVTFPQFAF